jgi:hypothetical protein
MMKASELKAWVATLNDDDIVAIDDGGLAIIAITPGNGIDAFIELGCMPRDEDDSEE